MAASGGHVGNGLLDIKQAGLGQEALGGGFMGGSGVKAGFERDQVIAPSYREAMASIVKEADLGLRERTAKWHHGLQQLFPRHVVAFDDFKAKGFEQLSHAFGIVHRISKRSHGGFITGIADDESDPLRRLSRMQVEPAQQNSASE